MRPSGWFALLLAAATIAWLLCRDDASAPVTDPATRSTISEDEHPSASAQTTTESSHRTAVAREAGEEQGSLRVLAQLPNGEPAAGAVVRFSEKAPERARRTQWDWHRAEDLERELTTSGREAIADSRGIAIVPVSTQTLCVRSGDFYGEAEVGDGRTEVRVLLSLDITILVLVRDQQGRPREHFDVTANVLAESRIEGAIDSRWRLTTTDARGLASLPHAQLAVPLPGPDLLVWKMVLECDYGPELERTVTAAEFAAERPLVLEVPAGGSIAVEVQNPDDRSPWADVSIEDPQARLVVGGDPRDDAYWFQQLPLGRRWIATVESFGERVQREIDGPTQVDEVVRVRIDLPLLRILVRGRVVRPDGVPVPRASIRFAGAPVRFFRETTESRDGSLGDRVGDFAFHGAMPADVANVAGATLHVERESYCVPTTIVLPTLHAGENELGDVVVQLPPDEMRLASVEVRAGGRNISQEAWAFLQAAGDTQVNSVTSIRAVRDDRIEFLGPRTPSPLVIGASCDGFLSRRVPVRLGEHVVVELEPEARLAVRALLPPVPQRLCTAVLSELDANAGASRFFDGEGYSWDSLSPGRYRLRLFVDGRPVHEVAAIDLVRGANVWPPDGGAIDLRSRALAHHVDVRAEDDSEIERWRCYVLPVDRGTPPEEFDRGEFAMRLPQWFVVRSEPVELVVTAAGFVPKRVLAPTADTVVRLTPCTKVRVHAPAGENVRVGVVVVEDGVCDPWLRALDADNVHEEDSSLVAEDEPAEFAFAPGTVVELSLEREGVTPTPRRVTVGNIPLEIVLR